MTARLALVCCLALTSCHGIGPQRLTEDQLGFSRALAQAENQQTLLNIVRLRYADLAVFLDATQVISGYQSQQSATAGFEAFPHAPLSTYVSGGGSVQLQQSPTFTFQPLAGDNFAQSVLRPIAPATLLPLIQGGIPVDVLFRLAVQSMGRLQNTTALTGRTEFSDGDFFRLLAALRRMQIAGLISVRFTQETVLGPDGKPARGPEHVFLTLAAADESETARAVALVHALLHVPATVHEVEIVYGRVASGRGQVPLLTRSVLGALGQIGIQADVPEADVASGRTLPTITDPAVERRPVVIIHSGRTRPPSAFTDIEYGGNWFWISNEDFDSKLAFLVVNLLLALSKNASAPGTVITIPAG